MSALLARHGHREVRQGRPVGTGALLRAEMLRTRRTATWGVPLAVALFSAQALFIAHTARTAEGWNDGVMAWMGSYPTAFALPMGALVGAMTAWREQRLREGGTAWRAVGHGRRIAARLTVIAASAVLSQVLLMGPVVADALARGHGLGPWPRYLAFMAVMTVAVSSAGFWGLAIGQRLGGVAVGLVPTAALCWSVAGAVRAESASWWTEPWTWAVRPVLPLLGVHGNNLSLEPGSPVWHYPILPGVLLTATLGTLGAFSALAGARRRPAACRGWIRGRWTSRVSVPPSALTADATHVTSIHAESPPSALSAAPATSPARRSVALAVGTSLPWSVWGALGLVLVTLTGVVNVVYPASYSLNLFTLAGAPTAAWVAGITSWSAQAQSWRALVLRARPVALTAASLAWVGVLLLIALVPAWTAAVWGEPLLRSAPGVGALSGAVYALLVMPCVCFMLAAIAHVLAQVTGLATPIVVGVAAFLCGAVVAGNEVLVGTRLWVLAPWGWVEAAAAYPERWVVINVVSLLIGGLAVLVSALSGRRVAARSRS